MKFREYDVVITSPSCGDGIMRVHGPGCRDIERDLMTPFGKDEHGRWPATVRDFHDVVLEVYGPNSGSYFRECGMTMLDWAGFGADIHVMPCVGPLPYDLPISDDDRAERYGDDRGDV